MKGCVACVAVGNESNLGTSSVDSAFDDLKV